MWLREMLEKANKLLIDISTIASVVAREMMNTRRSFSPLFSTVRGMFPFLPSDRQRNICIKHNYLVALKRVKSESAFSLPHFDSLPRSTANISASMVEGDRSDMLFESGFNLALFDSLEHKHKRALD